MSALNYIQKEIEKAGNARNLADYVIIECGVSCYSRYEIELSKERLRRAGKKKLIAKAEKTIDLVYNDPNKRIWQSSIVPERYNKIKEYIILKEVELLLIKSILSVKQAFIKTNKIRYGNSNR